MTNTIISQNFAKNFSDSLRRSTWISIIESFITILIGIFITIYPSETLKITSYVIGGVFSVRGLYLVITYFLEKGYRNFFNNSLLTGIVSLLIGIVFLVSGTNLLGFFRIILGALILYCALARINLSIKLHSASIKNWYIPLLFSLASLALGLYLIFDASSAIILAGWFLTFSGFFNAISDIFCLADIAKISEYFTKTNK